MISVYCSYIQFDNIFSIKFLQYLRFEKLLRYFMSVFITYTVYNNVKYQSLEYCIDALKEITNHATAIYFYNHHSSL